MVKLSPSRIMGQILDMEGVLSRQYSAACEEYKTMMLSHPTLQHIKGKNVMDPDSI